MNNCYYHPIEKRNAEKMAMRRNKSFHLSTLFPIFMVKLQLCNWAFVNRPDIDEVVLSIIIACDAVVAWIGSAAQLLGLCWIAATAVFSMHVSGCIWTGLDRGCTADISNSEASLGPDTAATALRLIDWGLDKIAPISRICSRLAVA